MSDEIKLGYSVREPRDLGRYYFAPGDHAGRDMESHRASEAASEAEWKPMGKPANRKPEVLRLWLEAELGLSGATLEQALGTVKRGRPARADRPLYDALARGVAQLRRRGATLAAIGQAIGRGAQTVANLEARGRELERQAADEDREPEPEPCPRHASFERDCPACLRNAPEKAVEYHGHPQLRGRLVGGSA